MAKKKKKAAKRKAPRKRADTVTQVIAQLERYDRLGDKVLTEVTRASVRLAKYRGKAKYYRERLALMRAEANSPTPLEQRELAKKRKALEAERKRMEKLLGKQGRAITL